MVGSLLFALVFLGALLPASEGGKLVPVKKYSVDLDDPPEERWNHVLSDYNSSVPLIIDYMDQQAPAIVRDVLSIVMGPLDSFLGDLGKEMKGIAEYWNIDLWIVVSLNFAYEFRRLGGGHPNTTANSTTTEAPVHDHPFSGIACTSIVAEDNEGIVYHGRNLDWNLPDNLRNLTIQVDFVKGGKVVFSGISVAGFVGILTGMSSSGFSVTANERDLGGNIVLDALEALLKQAWSPTHLARSVLTEATSYNEAVAALAREDLTAPVYYITAGSQPNEGAVITRDRNQLKDLWQLNVSSSVENSWYLLETNYDHWKTVYPYDDRRSYGNRYMQALGRGKAASIAGLQEVLTQWPVQNGYTTHTALMCPRQNTMEAYVVYT